MEANTVVTTLRWQRLHPITHNLCRPESWLSEVPVLTAPTRKGWPGWVGLDVS